MRKYLVVIATQQGRARSLSLTSEPKTEGTGLGAKPICCYVCTRAEKGVVGDVESADQELDGPKLAAERREKEKGMYLMCRGTHL